MCSNSISLFFHYLDSGKVESLVELFEEDGILFVRFGGATHLFMGRKAISGWANGIIQRFHNTTHWESNIVIQQRDDVYTNQSYWQSRNGSEVCSYGTHNDILVLQNGAALFRYRSVDITWNQEGHCKLPPEDEFAKNLYQTKLKWTRSWSDISEDNLKWKKGEEQAPTAQLEAFERNGITKTTPLRVFAPLCGDPPILNKLFERGDYVVGLDCSMAAIQALFRRVETSVTTDVITLRTPSGIAKMPVMEAAGNNGGKLVGICADVFFEFIEEEEFDLIFDKDALGALPYDIHQDYVKIMSKRLTTGGFIYLEAKYRADEDTKVGPPFHISQDYVESLFENFKLLEVKENPFGDHYSDRNMAHVSYVLQKQT